MKIITNSKELNNLISERREVHPLVDMAVNIEVNLRVAFLLTLFGTDFQNANNKFYRWVWEHKNHQCEECLAPLHFYSAVFVSHILTKGGHREMAVDPRNTNILCGAHHGQWEDTIARKTMRIYSSNQLIIELLKSEYNDYNKRAVEIY